MKIYIPMCGNSALLHVDVDFAGNIMDVRNYQDMNDETFLDELLEPLLLKGGRRKQTKKSCRQRRRQRRRRATLRRKSTIHNYYLL